MSTRTIWILHALLEALQYGLIAAAVGPLGTQHPTWILGAQVAKVFLSSLLTQAGINTDPAGALKASAAKAGNA